MNLGILSWTRCKRAELLRAGDLERLAEFDLEIVEAVRCLECGARRGQACHVPGHPQKIREPHLERLVSFDRAGEAAA